MAKSKVKVKIDPRDELVDFSNKMARDEVIDDETIFNAMIGGDWTDDPGTGKTVLLPDGRELLNPVPVAPPLSIAQNSEPSVNELVERALARHFEQLKGDDEVDSAEDMDDFPEDEEFHPSTVYEVMPMEAPAIPKVPVADAGGDGAKEPPKPPAPPVAPSVERPANA